MSNVQQRSICPFLIYVRIIVSSHAAGEKMSAALAGLVTHY